MTDSSCLPEGLNPLADELICRVIEIARVHQGLVYLVGGYIRDAIIGRHSTAKPRDLDFAVAGIPAVRLARIIADDIDGHYVLLDEECDTARVVLDDGTNLDFAGCEGGTIESDLTRRDFTVNALAWSPDRPGKIIDLVDGINDLKEGRIRAVSEAGFVEDPLRLLRAYRFKACLGFDIEERTLGYISRYKDGLNQVAAERINSEMFALLGEDGAGKLLEEMGNLGLIEIIFPDLVATRRVTANAFHHLGLFDHSVEAVYQLELVLSTISDWVRESVEKELSHGVSRLAATKLACLLHDIGKPDTWQITEEGRHTFYAHDSLGAEMAERLAEKMKWSRPLGRFIVRLIKWHLKPGQLFHQGAPTPKALNRFYRNTGEDIPELMLLAYGDLGATRGEGLTAEVRLSLARNFDSLLSGYLVYKDEKKRTPRLLNGQDIMDLLAIEAGPLIGELLEALDDAQEIREVTDRSAAERFVRSHYSEKYCS